MVVHSSPTLRVSGWLVSDLCADVAKVVALGGCRLHRPVYVYLLTVLHLPNDRCCSTVLSVARLITFPAHVAQWHRTLSHRRLRRSRPPRRCRSGSASPPAAAGAARRRRAGAAAGPRRRGSAGFGWAARTIGPGRQSARLSALRCAGKPTEATACMALARLSRPRLQYVVC
jgi:hypothetical protein